MAIPGNKLSSEPVVAPYLDPDGRTYSLNEDWEAGPKYVNDTSEGLSFQAWHLTYSEIADYNPPVMQYDGVTGYYSASYTSSGNIETRVARLKTDGISGGGSKCISQTTASGNLPRVSLRVVADDNTSTSTQGKLIGIVWDNSPAVVTRIYSETRVDDGAYHTVMFSYDGDAGTAQMVVDGVIEDDLVEPNRIGPVVATLPSGASSTFTVGGNVGNVDMFLGDIGYVGLSETYLTNYADFMDGSDPKQLDETGWTEWGSQPLYWNDGGKMDENKGSAGNMTQNGIITPVIFPSGGTFTITPEDEGAPYPVLSGQNSVQCTFAFDNNARPTIAWVDDTDQAYIYWYSPIANAFIITEVATPVVGIALTLDDKRITQQQANDILAWYTLPTGSGDQHILYMRRQRDRYDDIYEMLNPAWPYIHKCGMNEVNRVQLDLSTEAPA